MTLPTVYAIVDKNDTEIGKAPFEELTPNTIHRTSSLIIENSREEILVVQRGLALTTNPGKWSFSAAGRLEPGETYESNIVKETLEELGLDVRARGVEPNFFSKVFVASQRPHFSATFHVKCDVAVSELQLQPNEVAEARWVTKEDLRRWLQEKSQEFTPSYRKFCEQFLHAHQSKLWK